MKIILSIVGFVYLFCSTAVAQTNACPISGNYIGKSAVDLTISAIEIGENDNYVMKIYDLHRNLLRTCRGQWKCTTDTLQLDDKSGAVIYLKKTCQLLVSNRPSRQNLPCALLFF